MQGARYAVDVVLCIDATGSMSSIIDRVKHSALRFYDDLMAKMRTKGRSIDELRVRIIAFRDYYADGANAVSESDFYSLPQEKEGFNAFVRSISADGGGDDPENGLEALALAIQSDWTTAGDKRRHVVVVWTDTSAHPLERNEGSKPGNYPNDLPKNFDDLTDMWEGQTYLNISTKRLVVFAPDAYAWTDIANNWENVVHYPSQAGHGLSDIDYETILDAIAESV